MYVHEAQTKWRRYIWNVTTDVSHHVHECELLEQWCGRCAVSGRHSALLRSCRPGTWWWEVFHSICGGEATLDIAAQRGAAAKRSPSGLLLGSCSEERERAEGASSLSLSLSPRGKFDTRCTARRRVRVDVASVPRTYVLRRQLRSRAQGGMAVEPHVAGNAKPLVPLFTKASDCVNTSCYWWVSPHGRCVCTCPLRSIFGRVNAVVLRHASALRSIRCGGAESERASARPCFPSARGLRFELVAGAFLAIKNWRLFFMGAHLDIRKCKTVHVIRQWGHFKAEPRSPCMSMYWLSK